MSDGYEVETDRLAGQQAQLDPIAGRVGDIHQTLTAALAESGACWGSDAVGQSFAASHAGPADSTIERLGSLPAQLTSVGDRFTATAATYEGDDQHGVQRLRAAGPDLTEA